MAAPNNPPTPTPAPNQPAPVQESILKKWIKGTVKGIGRSVGSNVIRTGADIWNSANNLDPYYIDHNNTAWKPGRSLKEYTPEQIQAAVNWINNAGPGVQIPASLLPVVGALLDDQASIGTAVKTGLDFSKLGWLSGLVGEGLIGIGNAFDDNDNVITRWGHGLLHPDEAIDYISDMYSKITTGKDSIDRFNNTVALETPIDDDYLATLEYIRQRHAQRAIEKAKADAIAKDISAFNDVSKSDQTQTVDTKEPIQEQTQETTDTLVKPQGDDNMSFTWPSDMNVGAVVDRASQFRPSFNDTRPGDQPYLYGNPGDYTARRAAIDANSSNGTAAVTQGAQVTQGTQGTDSRFVPDGHPKNVVSNNESPVAHPSNDFSNQFMQYMMYKDFMKDQNRQATKQDMGIIPLLLAAYGIGRIIR